MGRWTGLAGIALALGGCTTDRVTEPAQTADEQLLVSTAVDRAIGNVKLAIPQGSKIYVDAGDFDTADVVLPKYTVGSVRDLILRSGAFLAPDRKTADLIAEIRDGAQAINHRNFLFGLPALSVPMPLAGTISTPELALFKRDQQRGVVKVAITLYSAKSGALAASSGPVFGESHDVHTVILLLFGGDTQDIRPDPIKG